MVSKELTCFSEITELFLQADFDLASFLRDVLHKTTQLIPATLAFVGIVEETQGTRWVVVRDPANDIIGAESGEWQRYIGRLKVGAEELQPDERSFVGYVARLKAAHRSGDVSKENFYRNSNDEIRSEIAVPVLLQGEVLAVINLESRRRNYYTAEHETYLTLLAKLIALPLNSLMIGEGLRRPFIEVLEKVAACISSAPIGVPLEATTALHEIASILAEYLDSGLCQIWTRHGNDGLALFGRSAHYDIAYAGGIPGEKYARAAVSERRLLKLGHTYRQPSESDEIVIPALAAPIMISGEPLGAIVVAFRRTAASGTVGCYTGADERLILSVQSQIAAAIEFKRSEQARRESSYEMSRLVSEVAASFTEVDLTSVLQKAVVKVPELCGARFGAVFLWEGERNEFVLAASQGLPETMVGIAAYSPGEGLTGWVGLHGRALLLDCRLQGALAQVAPDLNWTAKHAEYSNKNDETLHPFVAVPIFGEGRTIGVLRLSGRDRGTFTEAHEYLMTLVAGKISAAIAYSQRYEERIRLLRGLQTLTTYTRRFPRDSGHIDSFKRAFLQEAAAVALAVFNVDVVIIYRIGQEGLEWPPIWSGTLYHPELMLSPLGPSDVPSVIIERKESMFWKDALSAEVLHAKHATEVGSQKLCFVDREAVVAGTGICLKVGGIPVGVMFLNFRTPRSFDDERREIIEAFGSQVALSLETIALYDQIRESASREEAADLAVELHDTAALLDRTVVSQVGGILDRLRTCGYPEPDELVAQLRVLERNASGTIDEIRTIMSELRQFDQKQGTWYQMFLDYVERLEPANIKIILNHSKEKDELSPASSRHLYLIVRELFSNAVKYSGAKQISVRARVDRGQIRVRVRDNGVGFDPDQHSGRYGLNGVRRRIKKLNGKLDIVSRPGDTVIKIEVPIPKRLNN